MNECCPICGGDHAQNHHQTGPVSTSTAAAAESYQCAGETDNGNEEDSGEPSDETDPPSCGSGHEHAEADHYHDNGHACCGADHGQADTDLTGVAGTAPGRAVYCIDNMDCPMEETLIRGKLEGMPGVTSLDFNLMKRVLTVHHRLDSLAGVEKTLNSINMKPTLIDAAGLATLAGKPKNQWKTLALAGGLALAAEAVHFARGDHWSVAILALSAIALGGLQTYKKGWVALKNLNLNMNALMSFAVTGAMIIGQWPEAAMVMVLFALAEALEAKSLTRAREAIGELLNLTPEKATVRQADGGWLEQTALEVKPGSVVRVRPGERVALDGIIVSGSSAVNQAPITGESLPVEKAAGDQVFAGTINEMGSFEYAVTAGFENSTLARIIRVVEEAQATRAPIQRFVDKFAKVYTPIVFILAVLVGVLPPLLMNGQWLEWAYKALVLLVIACPCALVISTPVTIVSGLAASARQGLLIKGGAFLEQGRQLKVIALDKTGTLTRGRPEQTDFMAWAGAEIEPARILAASLAARSDHPVSRAVAEAAARDGLNERLEAMEFTALPGLGVKGTIAGRHYVLGNHKMIHDGGWCSASLEAAMSLLEKDGKSVIGLADQEKGVLAVFAVADSLKPDSRAAVAELRILGIVTVMLTGDNATVARAVAAEVGVDRALGGLLPEDKLTAIEEMRGEYRGRGLVGMVGDGINDAPALARADIGFAMGAAGTSTAIETADVAIMDDHLSKIPAFIRLSRRANSLLWQNICLAIGVKAVFFILTFLGQTTMWMAVFADIGVSLMVVANGLRLLRRRSGRAAAGG